MVVEWLMQTKGNPHLACHQIGTLTWVDMSILASQAKDDQGCPPGDRSPIQQPET